jgi:ABC-type dipeptide/oligopeptide/nickel transport system permease subunit
VKVTIDIDCTPLEARLFFGLPDVQPMQKAVLAEMEKRTLAEMEKFTPENLFQTWFSTGQQGADMFAKLLSGMAMKPMEAAKPR